MPTDVQRAPPHPRGQERRAQLIAYATTLFATKGYHPSSVADIVEGVGVGKGVFYWYFASKEELFVEILHDAQKDLRRRQQKAIADVEDPVERIAKGVHAAVIWSAEHRDLFHLFEFAATDETFGKAMRAGRSTLVGDAVEPLKAAIAEGRIPDRDPEQLAHAILGVSTLLTLEYVHHRGESAESVADIVVDFCLGGIGARSLTDEPPEPFSAWARSYVGATEYGRRLSRVLLVGAWLALVVGVGGSVVSFWAYSGQDFGTDDRWQLAIAQSSYPFVIALLVAGLLATCSGYLRFQVLRAETDLVEHDDEDDEPTPDA